MRALRRCIAAIGSICVLAGSNSLASSIDLTQVTSTTVTATIQPDGTDIGKRANIWVGAAYGGTLLLRNGANWVSYAGGSLPVAIENTTLSASMPVNVVDGLNVSLWPGLQLYLGYGINESDMLTTPGRLAQIYPGQPQATVMTIQVTVPSNTPPADTIWLRTSMFFDVDAKDVEMTKVSSGPDVWKASISAPAGTILRYWYRRNGDWSKNEAYPIMNRNAYAPHEVLMTKDGTVSEVIAQWADLTPMTVSTGALSGLVTSPDGSPLAGIRVSAGPHQTMTRWDGTYKLLGIPVGPCEITFRAENGEYALARTSATVDSTETITANATMIAAQMVDVTFVVTVPESTPLGAVPRLFGDTYSLGMFPAIGGTAIDPSRIDSRQWINLVIHRQHRHRDLR